MVVQIAVLSMVSRNVILIRQRFGVSPQSSYWVRKCLHWVLATDLTGVDQMHVVVEGMPNYRRQTAQTPRPLGPRPLP